MSPGPERWEDKQPGTAAPETRALACQNPRFLAIEGTPHGGAAGAD